LADSGLISEFTTGWISGVYQPDSGSLHFENRDLPGLPAQRRVRLGVARTFRRIRLFKQLSVLENVIAGFHVHHDVPAWQYLIHGAAFRRNQLPLRGNGTAGLRRPCETARRDHILATRRNGITVVVVEAQHGTGHERRRSNPEMDYGQRLFEGRSGGCAEGSGGRRGLPRRGCRA
jgi:ABC-type Fe3+/spermidine/putrescine transport system ATPase subunit